MITFKDKLKLFWICLTCSNPDIFIAEINEWQFKIYLKRINKESKEKVA